MLRNAKKDKDSCDGSFIEEVKPDKDYERSTWYKADATRM
jgi:hypothetical protein